MKQLIAITAALLLATAACSSNTKEKALYIPNELESNDFNDPESQWAYVRSLKTPNIVIYWEKGFGNDLSNPPMLEGQPMDVDIDNLAEKLEHFYSFYTDSLKFTLPGSKTEKMRMMVMLRYSLEGTAYGGDYDEEIGALWVTPNRLRDSTLNCVAHELGHSFQAQISCDGQGEAWGGNGFFEMGAQWMLWQVNPNWVHDEQYHFDAFRNLTHLSFLHLENIYHTPYIIETWGERHGVESIAELFRHGKIGEDPAMTYMRVNGLDQQQFNDEMYANNAKVVNMDFPRAWAETRPYAGTFDTQMVSAGNGWIRPATEQTPQSYGFNVIKLDAPKHGSTLTVEFEGLPGDFGCYIPEPSELGWRYGFVSILADGSTLYSPMASDAKGTISIDGSTDTESLFMVVMGAPAVHRLNPMPNQPSPQFPYRIKVG